MLELFSLKGRTAIVTGGEGLMGHMICQTVKALGGKPISVDISGVPTYTCDITRPEEIYRLNQLFPKIDILVNNAVGNQKPVDHIGDGWHDDLDIGLTAALNMIETFHPPVVLNMGSDLSLIGPDQSLYAKGYKPASYSVVKHGIVGLTRYIASTYPHIRCNCLCPGGIEQGQKVPRNIIGRNAVLDEMRGPVAFLLSDASSFMTGQVLVVDGGRTVI